MTQKKKDKDIHYRPKAGETKYPWEKWLDGRRHTLKPGKDFSCTMRSMVVYLYTRAKLKGCSMEVIEVKGNLSIKAICKKGKKIA